MPDDNQFAPPEYSLELLQEVLKNFRSTHETDELLRPIDDRTLKEGRN